MNAGVQHSEVNRCLYKMRKSSYKCLVNDRLQEINAQASIRINTVCITDKDLTGQLDESFVIHQILRQSLIIISVYVDIFQDCNFSVDGCPVFVQYSECSSGIGRCRITNHFINLKSRELLLATVLYVHSNKCPKTNNYGSWGSSCNIRSFICS